MALKGNLRDFTIIQLLNLVNLARKTGLLVIETPEETAQLGFLDGRLTFARVGQEDDSLCTMLYRRHKLTTSQYRQMQSRQTTMGDMELGLILVNSDTLTMQEIIDAVQEMYVSVVRRLFTLIEGFFRFDAEAELPEYRIPVAIELENLIIEGSRQIQEKEFLQEEIPSLDMALKFSDRQGMDIQKVNLSVDEWKVVSYVNPQNTIKQIAKATKMRDMEIRRIVYSLIQAGLVELIRPTGALPGAVKPVPVQVPDDQRSLVNRLIDRIRSI